MAYLKDGEPLICYTFYKCLCQAPRDDQVGSISAHVAQTLPTCGVLHVCTCRTLLSDLLLGTKLWIKIMAVVGTSVELRLVQWERMS